MWPWPRSLQSTLLLTPGCTQGWELWDKLPLALPASVLGGRTCSLGEPTHSIGPNGPSTLESGRSIQGAAGKKQVVLGYPGPCLLPWGTALGCRS